LEECIAQESGETERVMGLKYGTLALNTIFPHTRLQFLQQELDLVNPGGILTAEEDQQEVEGDLNTSIKECHELHTIVGSGRGADR
jgi:hypothetical protein